MFCHINNIEEFTYDGEPLVRVDGDAEEAGVGVDQLGLVSHHRVPEDARVPKESQVCHVLGHVKLEKRSQQMSGIDQTNLPLEG